MFKLFSKECKRCIEKDTSWRVIEVPVEITNSYWKPLKQIPPINTRILVANKDMTYFGFLEYPDGWDFSRKINLFGPKNKVWATYTNSESIAYWIELDLVKNLSVSDSKK